MLGLIKKYTDMACHNILCCSSNYGMTQPKKGFEEQWQAYKDELETLEYMAKLIEKVEDAPAGERNETVNNTEIIEEAKVWLQKQRSYLTVAKAIDMAHATVCMFLGGELSELYSLKVAKRLLKFKEELEEEFA